MKALFVHGFKFFEDSRGNLYLRGYDNAIWNRYLKLFDELYVIGRKISVIDMDTAGFNKFEGDKLFFIEVPDIYDAKNYLRNNIVFKNMAYKIIDDVDVIITRLPGTYSSKIINYAKKKNKPYLIELVGCPWDALWNHSIKGKLAAPYMWYSTRKAVINAPYVLYVTNEFLQRRYPANGRHIGCSDVSLPLLDEEILKNRLNRIEQRSGNKPIVIGTIGATNVRYKGQQYVIEAISYLNRQGYDFQYQVVGGGDRSFLMSLAEKYGVSHKVKFLGSLPHEKVFEYLDNIDLYIQPSKTEGMPRALIEAMSRGCPAIGSNTGGIPELLNKEFVFKKGSVKELCNLLKRLNKEEMQKEANRNFEKAKEYNKELLDQKRTAFFKEFVRMV
ncbi:MAG TPA: glycosyltransferase [Pseudobacteroides sp.]|nr:glycosyltransferase [Pseudobacteroides sp.]